MLVFLAHLVAALYQRTRVPDVLFLILVGLALGPLTGLLKPGDFGGVGPVFTAVTLVVILFQGGIALDLRDLRRAFTGSVAVSLMGFVASIVVVGAIAFGVLDLGVRRSIMLGAILGGTSSIVVIPMVQQLRLGALARTVLAMESAITDVLCIVIALALLESLRLPGLDVGVLGGRVIAAFVLAAAAGVAAGLVWSVLLQRVRDLKTSTFTTAAFVFVVYGVIEVLGFSGAIAALAFGITPGNIEVFHRLPVRRWLPATPVTLTETEKNFFAELVFLLKTFFFVYIGLSLVLRDPGPLAIGLVVTVLLFAARAPVIRVSAPRAISAGDAAPVFGHRAEGPRPGRPGIAAGPAGHRGRRAHPVGDLRGRAVLDCRDRHAGGAGGADAAGGGVSGRLRGVRARAGSGSGTGTGAGHLGRAPRRGIFAT